MSNGIRLDNHGRLKDTATGQFVALPDGVHRIKVAGGAVFVFDEPEKPPPAPPYDPDSQWGEFQ